MQAKTSSVTFTKQPFFYWQIHRVKTDVVIFLSLNCMLYSVFIWTPSWPRVVNRHDGLHSFLFLFFTSRSSRVDFPHKLPCRSEQMLGRSLMFACKKCQGMLIPQHMPALNADGCCWLTLVVVFGVLLDTLLLLSSLRLIIWLHEQGLFESFRATFYKCLDLNVWSSQTKQCQH